MKCQRADQQQNIRQFWTEHRITLIAFETQYVYQNKPLCNSKNGKKEQQIESTNNKRKNIQFEGGFLFPGRSQDRLIEVNIDKQIERSQCRYLKQLFEDRDLDEDLIQIRQFIKIMLQLKHVDIFYQFMYLYDFIWRQIKDIQFDQLKIENKRMIEVQKVAQKVSKYVEKTNQFKILKSYMQDNKKQTTKLFKITVYCFLAQRYNFNINEYYAQAFEVVQEEKKNPLKKRKTQ